MRIPLQSFVRPITAAWSISLDTDYEGKQTFRLVEQIRSIADSYYPGSYYLAGEGVSTYDLMDTITDDMLKVNALAIGAVFLVLLMLMKSISPPVILVLSIETAIWLNLGGSVFPGKYCLRIFPTSSSARFSWVQRSTMRFC